MDKRISFDWLQHGDLHAETEGMLVGAQVGDSSGLKSGKSSVPWSSQPSPWTQSQKRSESDKCLPELL